MKVYLNSLYLVLTILGVERGILNIGGLEADLMEPRFQIELKEK